MTPSPAQLHRRALADCRRRWGDRDGVEDAVQDAMVRWLALPADRRAGAAPWVPKWAVHLLSPACRALAARRLRPIAGARLELDACPRIRAAVVAAEVDDAGFADVVDELAAARLARRAAAVDPSTLPPVDLVAGLLRGGWTPARLAAAVGVSRESVRLWSRGAVPRPRHAAALAALHRESTRVGCAAA